MWLFPFWHFASAFILLISLQSNCIKCIRSDEVILKIPYLKKTEPNFSKHYTNLHSKNQIWSEFCSSTFSHVSFLIIAFCTIKFNIRESIIMSRVICTNGELTSWQMSLWYKFNKEHLNQPLLSKFLSNLDQKIRNLPLAYRFSLLLSPHLTFTISLMVRKAYFLTFSLTADDRWRVR